MFEEEENPSLPLTEQTMGSSLLATRPLDPESEVADQDDCSWQVDGSNTSIATDKRSFSERNHQGLTMKDYEEQLAHLRKENFNLKLRIYFMEENRGIYQTRSDQENVYKVNIDLKVESEELKRELQEKKQLLSEAANALQALEKKLDAETAQLKEAYEAEKTARQAAESRLSEVELQQTAAADNERQLAAQQLQPGISDESRFLYAEAFGNSRLGLRDDNDSYGGHEKDEAEIAALKEQVASLVDIVTDKNLEIERLEKEKAERSNQATEPARRSSDASESETAKVEVENLRNQLEKVLTENERILFQCDELAQSKIELQTLNHELGLKLKKLENGSSEVPKEDATTTSMTPEEANRLQQELEEVREQANLAQEQFLLAQDQLTHKEKSNSEAQSQVADLQQLLQETEEKLRLAEEQRSVDMAAVRKYNNQIVNLQAELKQRNAEVLSFLEIIKQLKGAFQAKPSSQTDNEFNINNDANDSPFENFELDDFDYKHCANLITESRAIVENIVRRSSNSSTEDPVKKGLEARCEELEEALQQKEEEVDLQITDIERLKTELQTAQHDAEEAKEAIQSLDVRCQTLESKVQASDSNLSKALACIKGFVSKINDFEKETHSLKDQLQLAKKEADEQLVPLTQENEQLKKKILGLQTQIETSESRVDKEYQVLFSSDGLSKSKVELVNLGIRLANHKYSQSLAHYRKRYDKLRGCLKVQRDTIGLLQRRMEELADFLQMLLDSGDDTLNMSTLSADLRESIQDSINQSKLLSASILQELSAIEEHEDSEDDFDDEWEVPVVNADEAFMDNNPALVSELEGSNLANGIKEAKSAALETADGASGTSEEIVTSNTQYSTLLMDLRDSLRLRREAEEKCEALEAEVARLKRLAEGSDDRVLASNDRVLLRSRASDKEERCSGGSLTAAPESEFKIPPAPSTPTSSREGSMVNRRSRRSQSQSSSDSISSTHYAPHKIGQPRAPLLVKRDRIEGEDEWSEPDKEVSRKRIGLDPTRTRHIVKYSDTEVEEVTHTRTTTTSSTRRSDIRSLFRQEGITRKDDISNKDDIPGNDDIPRQPGMTSAFGTRKEMSRGESVRYKYEENSHNLEKSPSSWASKLPSESGGSPPDLVERRDRMPSMSKLSMDSDDWQRATTGHQQAKSSSEQVAISKDSNAGETGADSRRTTGSDAIHSLQSRLETKRAHLKSAEILIRELTSELRNTRAQLKKESDGSKSEEENQNTINELELRLKGQSTAIDDLKKMLAVVQRREAEARQRMASVEESALESKRKFSLEKSNLREEIASVQKRSALLEKEMVDLKQDLASEKSLSQSLAEDVTRLQAEKADMEKALFNLQSTAEDLDMIKESQKVLKEELLRILQEKEALEVKNERLQHANNTQLEQLENVNQKLTAEQELNLQMEIKLNEVNHKLIQYKKEIHTVRSSEEQLIVERDKLLQQTAGHEQLLAQRDKLLEKTATLEKSLKDLGTRHDKMKLEYSSLKERFQVLELQTSHYRSSHYETNMKRKEMMELQESSAATLSNNASVSNSDIALDSGVTLKNSNMAASNMASSQFDWSSSLTTGKFFSVGKMPGTNNDGKGDGDDMTWDKELTAKSAMDATAGLTQRPTTSGSRGQIGKESVPKSLSSSEEFELAMQKDISARHSDLLVKSSLANRDMNRIDSQSIVSSEHVLDLKTVKSTKLGENHGPLDDKSCCDAQALLQKLAAERDEALKRLKESEDRFAYSQRKKKSVENAIYKELHKTRDVLKKTKSNLERI